MTFACGKILILRIPRMAHPFEFPLDAFILMGRQIAFKQLDGLLRLPHCFLHQRIIHHRIWILRI